MKLWALKMLLVWRWRCGYWDWHAFKSAWAASPHGHYFGKLGQDVAADAARRTK